MVKYVWNFTLKKLAFFKRHTQVFPPELALMIPPRFIDVPNLAGLIVTARHFPGQFLHLSGQTLPVSDQKLYFKVWLMGSVAI